MSAFLTYIMQQIFFAFHLRSHRFHHPAATGHAVARIHVHVTPPKTNGAMIRISIPFNFRSAIFTNKVLYSPLEFFRLHLWTIRGFEPPDPSMPWKCSTS